MSFTVYGYERNPRTRIVRIVAAAEGIPLHCVEVIPREGIGKAEYISRFPLSRGKIPGLEGPDGLKLTETLAITTYLACINNKSSLLGDGSNEQRAKVLSWMSWANQELLETLALWFLPLINFSQNPVPASSGSVAAGRAASLAMLDSLEDSLKSNDGSVYLVGSYITLADIMVIMYVARGLEWVLGKEWRATHPNIMRLFNAVTDWEPVKRVVPQFMMVDDERRQV